MWVEGKSSQDMHNRKPFGYPLGDPKGDDLNMVSREMQQKLAKMLVYVFYYDQHFRALFLL